MDDFVNRLIRTCLFLAMAPSAGQTLAQALSDPTRPPDAAIATPSGSIRTPTAPSAPQLQSILMSRQQGGRQVAVINGETVRVGEKFGNAVLIRMTPTTVVLRRGNELQTLRLYPAPARRVGNGASR